jgi:hypothetical protein
VMTSDRRIRETAESEVTNFAKLRIRKRRMKCMAGLLSIQSRSVFVRLRFYKAENSGQTGERNKKTLSCFALQQY